MALSTWKRNLSCDISRISEHPASVHSMLLSKFLYHFTAAFKWAALELFFARKFIQLTSAWLILNITINSLFNFNVIWIGTRFSKSEKSTVSILNNVFLLNQVMLPHCEKLPPIGSKGSETCFRIGIPHMEPIFEGTSSCCYIPSLINT